MRSYGFGSAKAEYVTSRITGRDRAQRRIGAMRRAGRVSARRAGVEIVREALADIEEEREEALREAIERDRLDAEIYARLDLEKSVSWDIHEERDPFGPLDPYEDDGYYPYEDDGYDPHDDVGIGYWRRPL